MLISFWRTFFHFFLTGANLSEKGSNRNLHSLCHFYFCGESVRESHHLLDRPYVGRYQII